MKTRTQLALLVAAVVLPIGLLAGAVSVRLWTLQREAYSERFLERVSALRLALDTDLEATVRVLQPLGQAVDLEGADKVALFDGRFVRLLASNPAWAGIGAVGADGLPIATASQPQHTALPPPGQAMFAALRASPAPWFSDLTATPGGWVTYIGLAMRRDGVFRGAVYVAIEPDAWLTFLRRYPVSEGATLTLNDTRAAIMARTLNSQRWVGKRSGEAFWSLTLGKDEGISRNLTGLDGQRFYTAFSRSRVSGWVVGTGVPQEDVEAALRASSWSTALGALAAVLSAALFAAWIGRRIIGSMSSLALLARQMEVPAMVLEGEAAKLEIDEAEAARAALHEAASRLVARETQRSEALERERRARAEAERTNTAKDEFLAMLGHELRNPLSAIKSASALLGMPAATAVAHQRSRAVIDRQVVRLTDLVNDLLDVARLDSGKIVLSRSRLDLGQIARDVVTSFQDASRCAHLKIELALEPVAVDGDATRLEQIVSNLLDNACKYTAADGHVRVSTARVDGHAELTLADSGSGIAAELLPHVFDTFTQGQRTIDRAQGGIGLGLSITRRLVELHGGTITAESAGGERGASFRVRLPAATSSVVAAVPEAVPKQQGVRVVLVEDNPDNLELVGTLLTLDGHEVAASAADGLAGVDAIEKERPDVALIDIGLPGIDGHEVARRVRAGPAGGSVLLFALTGYGQPDDRKRALAAGFDAFFVKPFDPAAFETRLAEQLAKSKG